MSLGENGKNVDLNPSNKVSASNRPLLKCYYSMRLGPLRRLNSVKGPIRWQLKKIILNTYSGLFGFNLLFSRIQKDSVVKSKLSLQRDFSLDHVIIITDDKMTEQQNPVIDERILFNFSVLIFHCTYRG